MKTEDLVETLDASQRKAFDRTRFLFFSNPCQDEDSGEWGFEVNLNDSFWWACSDGEFVHPANLPRLAHLFITYGYHGVHYWVCQKRGMSPDQIQFTDIQRGVQFVAKEEALRAGLTDSQAAFVHAEYTIADVKREASNG